MKLWINEILQNARKYLDFQISIGEKLIKKFSHHNQIEYVLDWSLFINTMQNL